MFLYLSLFQLFESLLQKLYKTLFHKWILLINIYFIN